MPRRLRIESEGAIDHVMARCNARQKTVRDDAGGRRLIDGLDQSVGRRAGRSSVTGVRTNTNKKQSLKSRSRAYVEAKEAHEIMTVPILNLRSADVFSTGQPNDPGLRGNGWQIECGP